MECEKNTCRDTEEVSMLRLMAGGSFLPRAFNCHQIQAVLSIYGHRWKYIRDTSLADAMTSVEWTPA
jgi:hypothetical protein